MNRLLILLCALFGTFSQILSAHTPPDSIDNSIRFERNKSWATVLQKAAFSQKIIFLDAYTSWCAPCKRMERDVFSDSLVGSFFNEKFINVRMDMEKGEGVALRKQYAIEAFPTFIFLNPDGTFLHRTAGYRTAEDFLELGQIALNPQKNLLALQKRYDNGERSPDFLYELTQQKFAAADGSHAQCAEEYLKTQQNWSEEKNIRFIFKFVNSSNYVTFNYFLKNRLRFETVVGQQPVVAKMQDLIYQKINDTKEKPTLEQVDSLFAKAYPERAARLSANFRLNYYRQAGDRENYAKSAVAYFDKFEAEDAAELNDVAWTFYKVIEDPKMLGEATDWAKKSIRMEKSYANLETLASLYFKRGKMRRARKAAQSAIEFAKTNGDNYASMEALLTEILKK